MVSAAHPLAAEAGRDILAQGGTAMDAAVAIQAVLGLVEPQSSGLAGGGFLLHYDAAQNWLTSWDGRETAPAQITPDVFVKNAGSIKGFIAAMTSAQAVGVPGIPALLEQANSASWIGPACSPRPSNWPATGLPSARASMLWLAAILFYRAMPRHAIIFICRKVETQKRLASRPLNRLAPF
jgi:hypothetical protein